MYGSPAPLGRPIFATTSLSFLRLRRMSQLNEPPFAVRPSSRQTSAPLIWKLAPSFPKTPWLLYITASMRETVPFRLLMTASSMIVS